MKSNRNLTQEERYTLGYMKGFRIGSILQMREILIIILHNKSKGQGYTPCRATIHKINREIDVLWLGKVINALYNDQLSVETFELQYDRLFLTANSYNSPVTQKDFDKLPLQRIAGASE